MSKHRQASTAPSRAGLVRAAPRRSLATAGSRLLDPRWCSPVPPYSAGSGCFPDDVKTAPTDLSAAEPDAKPQPTPTGVRRGPEEPAEEPGGPRAPSGRSRRRERRARAPTSGPRLPDDVRRRAGGWSTARAVQQRVWLVKDDERVTRSYLRLRQRLRQPGARHRRGQSRIASKPWASTSPARCATSCASPRVTTAPRSASTTSPI